MFYGNPKALSCAFSPYESPGTDNCTVNSAIANTHGLFNYFFGLIVDYPVF